MVVEPSFRQVLEVVGEETERKGFENMVLSTDSDWAVFRESLLRCCRLGVFTSDVATKEIFGKAKQVVAKLNEKEDAVTKEDLSVVTEDSNVEVTGRNERSRRIGIVVDY